MLKSRENMRAVKELLRQALASEQSTVRRYAASFGIRLLRIAVFTARWWNCPGLTASDPHGNLRNLEGTHRAAANEGREPRSYRFAPSRYCLGVVFTCFRKIAVK
jgi:hypothetical protein